MTQMKIDITPEMMRPFAEEAARNLGYVDLGKLDDFNGWLVALWQSSPESGAFYGTPRPLHVLTAKGLTNPNKNLDASFYRAKNAFQRYRQKMRDMSVLFDKNGRRISMFPGIEFCAAPQDACSAAQAQNNKLVDLPPDLPMHGCDREVCACGWRLLSSWEMKRR